MGKKKKITQEQTGRLVSKEKTPSDSSQTNIPKGLPNLGNTCFFNSVTQCILQTKALKYYLKEVGNVKELVIPKDCIVRVNDVRVEVHAAKIPLPEPDMPFIKVFSNFLAEFICGRSPNPQNLFNQIARKVPRFRGWAQQDSHELLRYLLDALRTDEIERFKEGINVYIYKREASESGSESNLLRKGVELCRFGNSFAKNPRALTILRCAAVPLLDSVFGGTLLQTIRCSECKHISTTFEPFLDLSLPVVREDCNKKINVPLNKSKHQHKKEQRNKKKGNKKRKGKTEPEVELDEAEESLLKEEVSEKPGESDEEILYNGDCSEGTIEINGNVKDGLCDEMNNISLNANSDCISALLEQNGNEFTGNGVIEALKRYFGEDELAAADAYECEKCCTPFNKKKKKDDCRKTVVSHKRYFVFSPPPILTLHLKRFEQTHTFNRTSSSKIRGHIEFPMVLDLAPYCSKSEERVMPNQTRILYSLYGVVCHSGDLSGGHYVSYVRLRSELPHVQAFFEQAAKESFTDASRLGDLISHVELKKEMNGHLKTVKTPSESEAEEALKTIESSSRWFYCSDSTVSMTTETKVRCCEAYLLFYERVF